MVSMGLAEDINFSWYSLEELLEIKVNLEEEIASRPNGGKTVLGCGEYLIGEDLPAGIYTLKYAKEKGSIYASTKYYVYENQSMYKYDVDRKELGDMPRVEGYIKDGTETRIKLYPGEFLILKDDGAEFVRVGNVSERNADYEIPTGTTIPKGDYTIGKEIPSGTYNVFYSGKTTSRVQAFEEDYYYGRYRINGKNYQFNKEIKLDALNPEGLVLLNSGDILRVEYTEIIMSKYVEPKFSFN